MHDESEYSIDVGDAYAHLEDEHEESHQMVAPLSGHHGPEVSHLLDLIGLDLIRLLLLILIHHEHLQLQGVVVLVGVDQSQEAGGQDARMVHTIGQSEHAQTQTCLH